MSRPGCFAKWAARSTRTASRNCSTGNLVSASPMGRFGSRSAASPAPTVPWFARPCFCSNVEDTTDLTGDHAERTAQMGTRELHRRLFPPRRRRRAGACGSSRAIGNGSPINSLRGSIIWHLRLRRLRTLHYLVPRRHRRHRGNHGHPRRRTADERKAIHDLLRPDRGLCRPCVSQGTVRTTPHCCWLPCQAHVIWCRRLPGTRERRQAGAFYLIPSGKVSLGRSHAGPRRGSGANGRRRPGIGLVVAGAAAPMVLRLSGRRSGPGAACLQRGDGCGEKCEQDHELGYHLSSTW